MRTVVVWLSVPLILVGLAIGCREVVRYKYQRERVHWKTAALSHLSELSLTNADINDELEKLMGSMDVGENQEWVGEHLLLMTNGEFLVYSFRHGFNSGFVDHLFLARGSDGRWLYSTYHFCNGMVGARMDEPPGSIAEFASRYSAREFDGRSDVCLQHTWPEND